MTDEEAGLLWHHRAEIEKLKTGKDDRTTIALLSETLARSEAERDRATEENRRLRSEVESLQMQLKMEKVRHEKTKNQLQQTQLKSTEMSMRLLRSHPHAAPIATTALLGEILPTK